MQKECQTTVKIIDMFKERSEYLDKEQSVIRDLRGRMTWPAVLFFLQQQQQQQQIQQDTNSRAPIPTHAKAQTGKLQNDQDEINSW
jgi:hypothetical protein